MSKVVMRSRKSALSAETSTHPANVSSNGDFIDMTASGDSRGIDVCDDGKRIALRFLIDGKDHYVTVSTWGALGMIEKLSAALLRRGGEIDRSN